MRGWAIGLGLLVLSACSKPDDDDDAAGFVPPTIQTRADFESQLDARFSRLDRNTDGVITAGELPKRNPGRVAAYDADQNGSVTRAEFVTGALALFDRADANHDASVTTAERQAIGWAGRN